MRIKFLGTRFFSIEFLLKIIKIRIRYLPLNVQLLLSLAGIGFITYMIITIFDSFTKTV